MSIVLGSPASAQEEWVDATCSFWFKGKYLYESMCTVAWKANRVTAITSIDGLTRQQSTTRAYDVEPNNGWVYGRNKECLLLPSTGFAICQKSSLKGHRLGK